MAELVLYHHPTSYYSQIARLALVEAGVEWERRFVDIGPWMENYEPWYARINPEMVVPTLVHAGTVVTETTRISRYVDEQLPGAELTPEALSGTEAVDDWSERIGAFEMREYAYGSAPPGFLRRRIYELRKSTVRGHLESNPDLEEAYRARLKDFEEWEAVSSNDAAIADLEEELDVLLDDADTSLAEGAWLAGDRYSRADVFLTVLLARLQFLGDEHLWEERGRTSVSEYYDRVRSRPSFEEADIWNRRKALRLAGIVLGSLWKRLTGAESRPPADRQLE